MGWLAKSQVSGTHKHCSMFSISRSANETKVLYLACYFHRIPPLPSWHPQYQCQSSTTRCMYGSISPDLPDACVRFPQCDGKLNVDFDPSFPALGFFLSFDETRGARHEHTRPLLLPRHPPISPLPDEVLQLPTSAPHRMNAWG
jgi:hypothetical protein